eukprot:691669-Alexandrium_andersonii.AAC.1
MRASCPPDSGFGYCRDKDGTPKVAIVTGSSARVSERWFRLFQGIRKSHSGPGERRGRGPRGAARPG